MNDYAEKLKFNLHKHYSDVHKINSDIEKIKL